MMLLYLWIVFLISIHGYRAQQMYLEDRYLVCNYNSTTSFLYTCNGAASCLSYLTFRSQPPLYNTPSSIAALLNSNPDKITALNNFASNSATIPADTIVIVPISNCSCTDRWYQHNANYVLRAHETYFVIANDTFQGLATCEDIISQNTYGVRDLFVGDDVTVLLRCACPTANQAAAGVKYLVTYLVAWGDRYEYMSTLFDGIDVQSIFDANELTASDIVFPFTPLLIPLRGEPIRINVSVPPAPPRGATGRPPAPPVISVAPGSGGNKWVFFGVGVGVSLLLLLPLSWVLVWFFTKWKTQRQRRGLPPAKPSPATALISAEGVRSAVESLTVYKFEELQNATGDFSEENRVKGSVYRGVFRGDSAAVKIMKGDVSGEINILKQINHFNIIRLFGFCLHQGNTYLVYEFAANYSLSEWLHSSSKNTKYDTVLEWKHRAQIAYDIAGALNYLHNFITPPYIHKNLKSSNVLLDTHMRAQITNFGLAQSVVEEDDDGELQLTRHVVGTFGYMPPEYIENGLTTPKMDVFALWVLISELLSGKVAATRSPYGGGGAENVAELPLSEMIKEVVVGEDDMREKLYGFMDGRLGGDYPVEPAYSMAEIASRCVAADLNDRPSMEEVLMLLSRILSSSLDWYPSHELEYSRSLSHGR